MESTFSKKDAFISETYPSLMLKAMEDTKTWILAIPTRAPSLKVCHTAKANKYIKMEIPMKVTSCMDRSSVRELTDFLTEKYI